MPKSQPDSTALRGWKPDLPMGVEMDLIHILEDLRNLRAAIESKDWIEAYRLFVELQQHALEILKGFGGANGKKKGKAASASEDDLVKLEDEFRATMAAAAEAMPDCCLHPEKSAKGGGPVGKLGDGKLLEIIIQVLPFILKFFF